MAQRSAAKPKAATAASMITTQIKRAGGSLLVTVPAPARKLLGFSEGQQLTVTVEDGRLVYEPVTPARRRRYSLAELLAQSDGRAPVGKETQRWLDAPAKGKELW